MDLMQVISHNSLLFDSSYTVTGARLEELRQIGQKLQKVNIEKVLVDFWFCFV